MPWNRSGATSCLTLWVNSGQSVLDGTCRPLLSIYYRLLRFRIRLLLVTRVNMLFGGAMLPIRGKHFVDAHMHLLGMTLLPTVRPLEQTLCRQVPNVPMCRPSLVLTSLNLLDLTTCGTGLHGNSWLRHLLPPQTLNCMLPWSSLWPTDL